MNRLPGVLTQLLPRNWREFHSYQQIVCVPSSITIEILYPVLRGQRLLEYVPLLVSRAITAFRADHHQYYGAFMASNGLLTTYLRPKSICTELRFQAALFNLLGPLHRLKME